MQKYYYHRSCNALMISDYFKVTTIRNFVYFTRYDFDYSKSYVTRCMNPLIINMINHNLHVELKESFLDLVRRDIKRIDKIQNKVHKK